MAKSARASRIKANKHRLRQNIFKSAEIARVERLHERLLKIANVQSNQLNVALTDQMASEQGKVCQEIYIAMRNWS